MSCTLSSISGAVKLIKPNATPELIRQWVNERIRAVVDSHPYWSGLLKRGTINVPAAYTTGSIDLTTYSTSVEGNDTAWPVSDFVNTTLTANMGRSGVALVTPASMANITTDSVLVIDGDNEGSREIIAVTEVTSTGFVARFAKAHAQNAKITASSLAGRQFRTNVAYSPIFTIRAVIDATHLELDMPWNGDAASATAYSIIKRYYTFPGVKSLFYLMDPVQPRMIRLHVPLGWANASDPQRTQVGPPHSLIDLGPNENGNMQYELYPALDTGRQLHYFAYMAWPALRLDTDLAPPFINENVFIYGARAEARATKLGNDDQWYDPKVALGDEAKYREALAAAIHADNEIAQRQLEGEYDYFARLGGGMFWNQQHAPVEFWGGD